MTVIDQFSKSLPESLYTGSYIRAWTIMTPCYCGTLGGLHVLVGSLTYPSPGRMFEPSCFGRLQCLEAGLTSRPLLALPGLCLMPDL